MPNEKDRLSHNPWAGWRPSSSYGGGGMRYDPDEIRHEKEPITEKALNFSWLIDNEVAGQNEMKKCR